MPETTEGRVAVYIDFDNIVISRYDQKNGRGSYRDDRVSYLTPASPNADSPVAEKLRKSEIDIGAILDYASSFGSIVISRAYADWSLNVNSNYRRQLMERAVDLVQLFPAVKSKNGADIRLAVDVMEDLFRLEDLSHVVIVAGDSDFIPLAQRCIRLGRYVVGIGVAGSTSHFLASACDEFTDYDSMPGLDDEESEEEDAAAAVAPAAPAAPAQTAAVKKPASDGPRRAQKPATKTAPAKPATPAEGAAETKTEDSPEEAKPETKLSQQTASKLLVRAMRLGEAKSDSDWLSSSAVKNQMLRMNPSFQESALGYKNFTDFVKSRGGLIEIREVGQAKEMKLRPTAAKIKAGG